MRDQVEDALKQSDSAFCSQTREQYLDRIYVGARSHGIFADGLDLQSLLNHDIFDTLVHLEGMGVLVWEKEWMSGLDRSLTISSETPVRRRDNLV